MRKHLQSLTSRPSTRVPPCIIERLVRRPRIISTPTALGRSLATEAATCCSGVLDAPCRRLKSSVSNHLMPPLFARGHRFSGPQLDPSASPWSASMAYALAFTALIAQSPSLQRVVWLWSLCRPTLATVRPGAGRFHSGSFVIRCDGHGHRHRQLVTRPYECSLAVLDMLRSRCGIVIRVVLVCLLGVYRLLYVQFHSAR